MASTRRHCVRHAGDNQAIHDVMGASETALLWPPVCPALAHNLGDVTPRYPAIPPPSGGNFDRARFSFTATVEIR